MSADEHDELVHLRREHRVPRRERDLRSRAAAFFAPENIFHRKYGGSLRFLIDTVGLPNVLLRTDHGAETEQPDPVR